MMQLTRTKLTSHPAASTASKPYAATSEGTSYPAACADAGSQPAALKAAASKPAALKSDKVKPAALSDGTSSPPTSALPSAAITAFTAGKLFILNNSAVRATTDAMWCREEEAPPALAA